jgi:hypothetical protein
MMFQNMLINNCTTGYINFALASEVYHVIVQDAVIEYDDFQIAVLMNWLNTRNKNNYGVLVVKSISFKKPNFLFL